MKDRFVADLMVRDVAVIRADNDVHELEKKLLKEKIHGMPVVDGEGRLVGVASQTDLLAWHYSSGVDGASFYDVHDLSAAKASPDKLRLTDIRTASVGEVMSPVVHCICPDEPIALAAARMISRRVHRLVVVDEQGIVLGILAAIDLLRALPGVEESLEQAAEENELLAERPPLPPRSNQD